MPQPFFEARPASGCRRGDSRARRVHRPPVTATGTYPRRSEHPWRPTTLTPSTHPAWHPRPPPHQFRTSTSASAQPKGTSPPQRQAVQVEGRARSHVGLLDEKSGGAAQLTGHARCVAADVRHRFEALPADSELRPLTKAMLRESVDRLSPSPATTIAQIQNRARLITALYRAHDRLDTTQNPASVL